MRMWFIMVNMQPRPLWRAPISQPRAPPRSPSTIAQVGLAWIPILCSRDAALMSLSCQLPSPLQPARHQEQRQALHFQAAHPACAPAPGARCCRPGRARPRKYRSCAPTAATSRRPVVPACARWTDPIRPCGSVRLMAAVHSPVTSGGMYVPRSALVPVRLQHLDCADRSFWQHRKAEIRATPDLSGRRRDQHRQCLPAPVLGSRERGPASGAELPPGLRKSGGGRDARCTDLRALRVTDPIERREHLTREVRGAGEDCVCRLTQQFLVQCRRFKTSAACGLFERRRESVQSVLHTGQS